VEAAYFVAAYGAEVVEAEFDVEGNVGRVDVENAYRVYVGI
jgi:hypothetical protein